MKTIERIDEEITQAQTALKNCESREAKRLTEKIAALRRCRLYLESNPRPEFIKETIGTIKGRLMSIEEKYHLWYQYKGSRVRNPKAAYNTEMKVKTLEAQLKTLEYLMSS